MDVALANVIGATFFAVLVLFGFYAVYRSFQSRERAKRRIASDIIRVLKEDEEHNKEQQQYDDTRQVKEDQRQARYQAQIAGTTEDSASQQLGEKDEDTGKVGE